MKSIEGLFDKFKNRAVAEILRRESIANVLKKYCGTEIDIKDISISSGIVKIKTSAVVKSEILIKKQVLLREINKVSQLQVTDIA